MVGVGIPTCRQAQTSSTNTIHKNWLTALSFGSKYGEKRACYTSYYIRCYVSKDTRAQMGQKEKENLVTQGRNPMLFVCVSVCEQPCIWGGLGDTRVYATK